MSTQSLRDAWDHFSEVIDRVEHEHERVTVTRNGHAAAVILSPEDLFSNFPQVRRLGKHRFGSATMIGPWRWLMTVDTWSAAVSRLVTMPVRHDPRCGIGFTREARDEGWLEVSSPWDFGFGPGMPSHPDVHWGLFAVHPDVPRVALELRVGGTTVTSCRIGLWEDSYPVLVVLRAPSFSTPNSRTDWEGIIGYVESIARTAAVGGDDLGLSHVTTLLDPVILTSDVRFAG